MCMKTSELRVLRTFKTILRDHDFKRHTGDLLRFWLCDADCFIETELDVRVRRQDY